MSNFEEKVAALRAHHEELLSRKNEKIEWGNGIYDKYKNPVVTAEHVPLEWRNEVAGEIYISGTRGGSRPKELLCSGRES